MLQDKFHDYLLNEKKYSLHTVLAYSKDLASFQVFLDDNYENETLEEVTYSLIRSWIIHLINNKISNNSVNRKVASLQSFYKYLLKIKQIQINPLVQHKALKTPKNLQIPFSEEELNKVLDLMNYKGGFEGIRDKLIIYLFYTTGIRRSELIGLLLKNVDLSTNLIKVIGKRNKERIIPLLPVVTNLIRLYLEERNKLETKNNEEKFFLLSNGNKLNETFVYRLINDYLRGVSEKVKRSPHMLRHTFATHMINNGADLNSIKELLGHSSLASTQIYTHLSLNEIKDVYKNAHPRNLK